jgi:glycosyltransferase involved in cell wall biosynthesis
MASLALLVPGDLDALTGGYGYDRRIIGGLRDLGWAVAVETLDSSFPYPTAAARSRAAGVLARIPSGSTVVIDGLAFGVLPFEAEREHARLRLVALVHHPLAAETGLDGRTAALLEATERRALAATRLVVVTSPATAAALERYGVEAHRIACVEPGTDPAPVARGSGSRIVHLLCVASIIPRKGHETLVEALASLPGLEWRLTCVGSLERDPQTADRLRASIAAHGLVERVRFTGDLGAAALDAEYDRADAFVLPTFHEGYGMVVAEALARGLPIVSTPTGAIAGLVSDSAGLLVPPGSVPALAAALCRLIEDRPMRARLAAGARRVRDRLPTWSQAAAAMAAALERVGADG